MRQDQTRDRKSPQLARHFLQLCSPPDFTEAVLGDLEEEFSRRATEGSLSAARSWYRSEALRSGLRFRGDHAIQGVGPRGGLAALLGLATTMGLLALSLLLGIPGLLAGTSIPTRIVAGTAAIFMASVGGGVVIGRVTPQTRMTSAAAMAVVFMLFVRSEGGAWPHPAWVALQVAGIVGGSLLGSATLGRARVEA